MTNFYAYQATKSVKCNKQQQFRKCQGSHHKKAMSILGINGRSKGFLTALQALHWQSNTMYSTGRRQGIMQTCLSSETNAFISRAMNMFVQTHLLNAFTVGSIRPLFSRMPLVSCCRQLCDWMYHNILVTICYSPLQEFGETSYRHSCGSWSCPTVSTFFNHIPHPASVITFNEWNNGCGLEWSQYIFEDRWAIYST